jgi:hypothetical protein
MARAGDPFVTTARHKIYGRPRAADRIQKSLWTHARAESQFDVPTNGAGPPHIRQYYSQSAGGCCG